MFLNDFFQFTSSQRRGVVVLLIVLGVLGVFYLINSNSVSKFDVIIHPFVKEKSDSIQSSKDTSYFEANKLFYFNPNLIYKDEWVRLGFSTKQVETILKYKEKIGGFKSKLDVKNCYVVSDQMYRLLSPYILIIDKDSKIQKLCNTIFLFQLYNVELILFDASCKKSKLAFSLEAIYIPYAAVTPINGAPLTCISFIAKQTSSRVFNSIIFNSNGIKR